MQIEVGDNLQRIMTGLWDDRVGYVKHIIGVTPTEQQGDALVSLDKQDYVSIASGHGCHSPATLIMLSDGSTKRADEIAVGDKLMGADSTPRTVTRLFSGNAPMFRVKYHDGTYYDVNGAHTLCLVATQTHGRQTAGDYVEVSVSKYLQWSERKRRTHAGYKAPIMLPNADLPIPPYILGVWLGDGNSCSTCITNIDTEVLEAWQGYAKDIGLRIRVKGINSHMVGDRRTNEYPSRRINPLLQNLQALKLIRNKHIPDIYMRGSLAQRRELLAGIIDTDGGLEGGKSRLAVTQKRELFARQILRLAQSIGCHATLRRIRKKCYNNGVTGTYYNVGITRNIELIPVRIARKKPPVGRQKQRGNLHFGFKIEELKPGEYFGFKVDGDNKYLLSDYTVTHNCGKSTVESWSLLHYMSCRPYPKIPCTAPSKHQLYDILWAELSKWHRGLNPAFANMFEWTKERFFHKAHPEEWFAVARTATKENPEALQGFHAKYVFRIIDEASGVGEPNFEVLEGAHGLTETKELMCANPTRLDGTFYRSHHQDRKFYKTLVWSCLDSSIVDPRYEARLKKKYGEESNIYRVRVLGQFPVRDGDSYIPFDLATDAVTREILDQSDFAKVFGCDIARYGDDDTVIAIRQGDEFKPYHVLKNKSTMEVTGYIARLANEEKPAKIFIDVIGLGAGVYDRLEELGYPVVPVNVSEAPAFDARNFKRLRDELWGNIRTWLEQRRGKMWDNDEDDLVGQLTTPRYRLTSDGKILIESKDDLRKRSIASPNVADAHMLTFAQPMAEYTTKEDDFFDDLYEDEDDKPFDPWAGY